MTTILVTGDESMQRAIGDLRQMFAEHGFLKMTVKAGKARSIPQNAITHAWYGQIARELREDDELGWKCYCKLHHGVPILRAEDAEFRETYDGAIKGLSYEQKLAVMKILPVTSLMTKAQLSKYAESVRDDFRARGVQLEFPQDARGAGMKKRTACFGWTKKFQRRVTHAADLMSGGKLGAAHIIAGNVKAAHIARVKQLRGVA